MMKATIEGITTVARWDLQQRVRSRKLLVGWVVWAAVLTITAGLIVSVAGQNSDISTVAWRAQSGPTIFGLTVLIMLGFSMVVVPIFSASAIVSERESSTLAMLQATTLEAGQIVGGKLLSACAVSAIFLAGGIPATGIAVAVGHISVLRALVCLLVMYAQMVLLCAIALGWSAIATRALVSTVLTYITIFALTVVTLIGFALLGLTTVTYETQHTYGLTYEQSEAYGQRLDQYFRDHPTPDGSKPPSPPLDQCTLQPSGNSFPVTHPERYWWLLLINPFVIVSDAAPLPAEAKGNLQAYQRTVDFDPLAAIAAGVRSMRVANTGTTDDCFGPDGTFVGYSYWVYPNPDGTYAISNTTVATIGPPDERNTAVVAPVDNPFARPAISMTTPLWPYGLGVHLLIAALFLWLAVRRVRVPYGRLPSGQRVA